MERKKYLILVAAGSGTRMGGNIPKQFIEIGGKAVLHRTAEKFAGACPGITIVTVLSESWKQYWRDYCYNRNFISRQIIVPGGITRFHSVKNALGKIPDGALVAVHDGVRPLVSTDMIRRLFGMAEKCPAVVPVVPVVDSIKVLEKVQGEDGTAVYQSAGETADRNRLFAAQTPQIFWSEVLKQAYAAPYSTSFTDDASVVERCGIRIAYPEGERYNIKITTPDDLKIAEALLRY